jgi:hypothetical protein
LRAATAAPQKSATKRFTEGALSTWAIGKQRGKGAHFFQLRQRCHD